MIQIETEIERICDIKDCHSKAAGFVKFPAPPLPMAAEINKNKV